MKAIETRYAGCRFRSRLEARWAVFFDHLEIEWQYEPQGFVIGDRPYLPDFLLTETWTWVEVKGDEDDLDHALMISAAEQLPPGAGPTLLLLGPLPVPPENGDWAWMGLEAYPPDCPDVIDTWWGFGCGYLYSANETSCAPPYSQRWDDHWLKPALDMHPERDKAVKAYRAARSARFEHGEKG